MGDTIKTKNYWLVKNEPESYSISDLKRDKKTGWSGVRNFQARNYMRAMQRGDLVLVYHSNCPEPGIYGVAKVMREAYPDPTQFDTKDSHYDPRATQEKPIWDEIEIGYVRTAKQPLLLSTMRQQKGLAGMQVLARGNRLSVTPVTEKEYDLITALLN